MKEHTKKTIAPVIIVLLISVYYLGVGFLVIKLSLPSIFKALIVLISIVITLLFIFTLVERIKEIKKGEEDDLSKY